MIARWKTGNSRLWLRSTCWPELAVCLCVVFGLSAGAETNSLQTTGSASKGSGESESLVKRAEVAAERAEAAARRAEAAAKRAEVAASLAERQGKEADSTEDADPIIESQIRSSISEDEELRCVRFMVGRKYFDFNAVDRQARLWLTKDGHAPPTNLVAEFEVADEKVFVAVKYGAEVGKRFWYVKFNKDMAVGEWGTRIRQESD